MSDAREASGGPGYGEHPPSGRRSEPTSRVSGDVPEVRLLLVGMMGAGKSSVGHALVDATGWLFLDNDELVERATGILTRAVLDDRGERALRAVESAALTEALKVPPPVIASVAGGVVTRAEDRERLREGGFVVWLRARMETLVARVGSGEGRPWLQPDPAAALRKLYDGRDELYTEVSSYIVDTDDLPPAEIAARIVGELRKRG